MKFIKNIIGALTTIALYTQKKFIFDRSKKHIISWGEYTYGEPTILNYDNKSKLTVGRYCSIASEVTFLLGANHKRSFIPNYPLSKIDATASASDTNDQGDIVVGHDVWIGYRATIIGPVTIGNGAIIGAGAVVVRDVPAFAVCVGVPAKVIKYRFDEDKIIEINKTEWWNWDIEKVQKNKHFLFNNKIVEDKKTII